MGLLARLARLVRPANALDGYVRAAPSPQGTVDMFRGEWISKLPPPLQAGHASLFDDPRIPWAAEQLGGFADRTILDLGSLEGGHPYSFERLGAREVVAIEGKTRAYLRCLVAKEVLGMRTSFLCGDFMEFLRANQRRFDVINASGVLYHQKNPAELIALLARSADRVIMWTQYYDAAAIRRFPTRRWRYSSGAEPLRFDDFTYQAYRHRYSVTLRAAAFCGGTDRYSHWMTRDDILRCFRHFGFADVRVGFELTDHPNGPSFNLVAIRPGG
jgi:hypothetical protein